jgi:DNA/RNA endonuclease YhcR with UshA esterase domain
MSIFNSQKSQPQAGRQAGENVNNQHGIAAFLTIVIVAAASLIVAYSASIMGLGELDLGYTSQQGGEALSVADGCMEETMRRIRLSTSYGVGSGTINLTVSNGSCTIDVTDLGSSKRRIIVVGTKGDYNKKIQLDLTLTGNVITVDAWEEAGN